MGPKRRRRRGRTWPRQLVVRLRFLRRAARWRLGPPYRASLHNSQPLEVPAHPTLTHPHTTTMTAAAFTPARHIPVRSAALNYAARPKAFDILDAIQDNQLLSKTAELGVLSKAEAAGVTLSDLEPLLIAADDNGAMQVGAGAGASRCRKLQPPHPPAATHRPQTWPHHATPAQNRSTADYTTSPPHASPLHQPTNQPTNQPPNHPPNQPTNQPTCQASNPLTRRPAHPPLRSCSATCSLCRSPPNSSTPPRASYRSLAPRSRCRRPCSSPLPRHRPSVSGCL